MVVVTMATKRLTNKEKKALLVRVSPDVHSKLVAIAAARRWSLQTLSEFILEGYTERIEAQAQAQAQGQQSAGK
jgi:predicted HicB family RNase H-like nuclease